MTLPVGRSLPQRHPSHELEDLSITALRRATPPDRAQLRARGGVEYGVDFDVELFADGYTTGNEFLLQMKSTWKLENSNKPLVNDLKISTLNYWQSLERPVLLALWEAETDTIWYRWSHDIDTYGIKPTQKTLRIKFDRERVLTGETWADIEAEVAAHRAITSARERLPLRVTVTANGSLGATSAGAVRLYLERVLREYSQVLSKSAIGQPEFRIEIRRDTVHIGTAALPATVIHYEKPQRGTHTPAYPEPNYAADIAIGIALQLSRLNLLDHAASIIRDQWRKSQILSSDFLGECVSLLANAGEVDEAIEMASAAHANEHTEAYALLPALTVSITEQAARRRIAGELAKWADRQAEAGNTDTAAMSLMNAARAIGSADIELSLQMSGQVASLDPRYRDRAYWWEERAGLLFLAGRYAESSECYRRAIELGDVDSMDLYGDALLYSGRYREALFPLRSGTTGRVRRAEFKLKSKCFEHLMSIISVDSQDRDPDAAEAAWDYFEPDMEKCKRTLGLDLMHAPALAWLSSQNDSGLDLRVAICAAFSAPEIPFLWERCLAACAVDDRELYSETLIAARQYCGTGLIDYLLDLGEVDAAEDIDRLFSALPPEEARPTYIYTTHDDGTLERIRLG